METQTTENLLLQIKELQNRLAKADQLIEAIKAGETDAFALNKDNQPEVSSLQSGDYANPVVVENFSGGALNLSEDGLIVYTNASFYETLQLSYEKVIGQPISQFIHPDSKETFNELFKKGLAGQSKGEINLMAGKKSCPVYVSLTSLYPSQPAVRVIVSNLTEKKQIEKELESKKTLQNIFQNAPAAIAVYEVPEYKYILANKAYEKLTKREAADLIGKSIRDVFPELKGTGAFELFDTIYKNGEYFTAPKYAAMVDIKNDGVLKQCYFDFSMEPLKNDTGEIYAIISMTYDVTEQVEAKNKIRESEQHFKNILLQSPNIFVIVEGFPEMIITFANESLFKSWGRTSAILGKPLLEVLPEIKDQPFPKLLQQVFETGKTYTSGEVKAVIIKNGAPVDTYFVYVYQPIFNGDRKVTGVTIMATDITEQVVARKTIEESKNQLQNIFLNAPAALCILEGTEHKYILANKAYQKLSNRKAEDLLGQNLREVFPELIGTGKIELFDNVFKTGETFNAPEYAAVIDLKNDGVPRQNYFDFFMEPLKNDSGEIYALMVMGHDITEQVVARKMIEESEKQQAFLLTLTDALRPLSNPVDIEEAVTKITRKFMDADWCLYATIEDDILIILRDAVREGLPSVAGTYQISNFALFKAILDAGRPFIVDDVQTTDILDEELKQLCIQLQNISFINVPVIKNGKPVGLLSIVQSKPRKWTDTEVRLSNETAERTWAAVERAKAEEALQQSEEKYRTLFNSIDEGFSTIEVMFDEKGKVHDYTFLEMNPAHIAMSGMPLLSVGKRIRELMPDIEEAVLEHIGNVVLTGEPIRFEQYVSALDRWFDIYFSRVGGPGSKKVALIFNNITERKQTENKIKASEQEIRKIKEQLELSIRAGKIGVWHWDVKNDLLYWSKEQKAIYGLEPSAELLNLAQYKTLVFPEDWERINTDLQSAPTAEEQEYDFRIIRKNDGEIRWVKSRARNILDEQGALQFISGVNIDITEQVIALNKIQESEKRFRNLAETLPQMVWVMNSDGGIEYGSKNWKEYSGIDDVLEAWNYMMHPDDSEQLTTYWNQIFVQGKGFQHEVRLKNKEGIYRWFYSVGKPVLDADEKINKWVGSLTDIHEQKLKEESKDEFISIASHELKTPLTTAKAYLQILERSLDVNDKKALYAKKATQSVNRLNDLISELLDVSKIQLGKLNYTVTVFNFNEMVDSTVENLQLTSATHTIIKTGEVYNKVVGDKDRLQQVVINLLTNAIKYSPGSEKIFIMVEQDTDVIKVTVKDTGIGIGLKSLDKIFEKYHRVEEHAAQFQGLGIGLFISYEIIQRHHGKLWAVSEVGKGSTFYFTLPISNTLS